MLDETNNIKYNFLRDYKNVTLRNGAGHRLVISSDIEPGEK